MGRKGRRKGPQGRAQNRVRERVRGGSGRGGARRGGGSAGRKRVALDADTIEDYAGRVADHAGGVSGLTGAAAGLAGGGLAGRFLGGGAEGSEEDPGEGLADHLVLIEERLQLLEDQVQELREMLGGAEAPTEPEDETEPGAP